MRLRAHDRVSYTDSTSSDGIQPAQGLLSALWPGRQLGRKTVHRYGVEKYFGFHLDGCCIAAGQVIKVRPRDSERISRFRARDRTADPDHGEERYFAFRFARCAAGCTQRSQ